MQLRLLECLSGACQLGLSEVAVKYMSVCFMKGQQLTFYGH